MKRLGQLCPLLLAICVVASCTILIPKEAVPQQASYDAGEQNSGLIALAADGRFLITAHARDRYNALIGIYGGRLVPPLRADDGLTATGTNTFLLDAEHLADFARMQAWKRNRL